MPVHIQFFTHQLPEVFLFRPALNPFIPQSQLITGILLYWLLDFAQGLVKFYEFHMSSLLKSIKIPLDSTPSFQANHVPLSLVSPPNFLRLHSISLFITLIKILDSILPNMDPEEHFLLTSSMELLTEALWIWPPSQYLLHLTIHPSNLYLANLQGCCWSPCQRPYRSQEATFVVLLATNAESAHHWH